ncbi:hypothetical protein BU26DRAFT_561573 [Trematosphaeria pertusa]|uniref:Uncharacterized protein n=1 Tax=Trematosphaeria pertusa TaxID=390896 RepID=A0A6A6INF0_9PLEO|nr:uncharacterized protein BU26DRAFT_561573 [Trematosphaeria pertusa]KAF2251767.1 hypothetical protein BU26DRAFT_561573 [Trematosphaeria pertusa]
MRFSTAVTALFALALSVSASPLEQRQTCDITTPEYCPGDLAGCKAFCDNFDYLQASCNNGQCCCF